MKRRKPMSITSGVRKDRRNRQQRRSRSAANTQMSELLRQCLAKVTELQAELEEEARDPQAAGYHACATEALRFLSDQGLSDDDPIVKALRERLLQSDTE